MAKVADELRKLADHLDNSRVVYDDDPTKIDAAADLIDELVAALEFYRDGFEPYQQHKNLPGLAWRPKEALLDDCGNRATAALARAKGEDNA